MSNRSILLKNKLDMMSESMILENFNTSNSMENISDSDLHCTLECVESFDGDIDYPVEAIPVIMKESVYGGEMYVVEYDMLHKIMESYDVDEVKAMEMVAEKNNISMDDFYLMIESQEYFEEAMKEAGSKGGNNFKSKKTQNLIKSIEDLKAKGIKLVKKKGCKK